MVDLIFRLWLYLGVARLGDVRPELIVPTVDAALAEQTSAVPAELIIALAWGESRFEVSAQPRCGVMQVWPADFDLPASECHRWRSSIREGVRAGVLEIETMLADRRVAGHIRLALLYRACGGSAFTGECTKGWWVDQAVARARSLEVGVPARPHKS